MKILMVTSETVPFAKTGGLADAVSALAINLRNRDTMFVSLCLVITKLTAAN